MSRDEPVLGAARPTRSGLGLREGPRRAGEDASWSARGLEGTARMGSVARAMRDTLHRRATTDLLPRDYLTVAAQEVATADRQENTSARADAPEPDRRLRG